MYIPKVPMFFVGECVMQISVWESVGFQKNNSNEATKIINDILHCFSDSIKTFLEIDIDNFNNLYELIDYGRSLNNSYSYFWDWFFNYGIKKIELIALSKLYPTDEILDFLDYRLYVLKTDIENKIAEGIISSLVETVTEIHNFVKNTEQVMYPDKLQSSFSNNKNWIMCSEMETPLSQLAGLSFYTNTWEGVLYE